MSISYRTIQRAIKEYGFNKDQNQKSITRKKTTQEKYGVEVSIITSGNVTIIQTFMPSSKQRLSQKIEDIYNSNAKIKLDEKATHLNLEISGDIGDATALMPLFRYNFKN